MQGHFPRCPRAGEGIKHKARPRVALLVAVAPATRTPAYGLSLGDPPRLTRIVVARPLADLVPAGHPPPWRSAGRAAAGSRRASQYAGLHKPIREGGEVCIGHALGGDAPDGTLVGRR